LGLGPVASRARVLVHEVLERGAQAVDRGGARYASQVLDRGAKTDACGAAQVLDLSYDFKKMLEPFPQVAS
jgi:hypothetical protein